MEAVIKADWDYYRCYAQEEAGTFQGRTIRTFRDEVLPDMYMHNFTAVHNWDTAMTNSLWEQETALARQNGAEFYNLFSWSSDQERLPKLEDKAAERSRYVYMKGPAGDVTERAPSSRRGKTVRAETQQHFDDYETFDVMVNGAAFGEDFCHRRSRYKSRIFAEGKGPALYLCYADERVVGSCEWFYHRDTELVKIEDFTVDPAVRRMGYGTAMLSQMMADAGRAGAREVYLITEADNIAAQRLYGRFGLETMDIVHVSWFVKMKEELIHG